MQKDTQVASSLLRGAPRPLWRKLLPLIGLLLLGFVLSRFDLRAMEAALLRVRPGAVLLAALLFSVNMLLKALRWQRMLTAQALRLPPRVAVAAFLGSQFYGQVTFGRVGELFRAEALIERGVPLGTALSSSIYDRVIDLATVLLVAATLSSLLLGDTRTASLSAGAMLLLFASGIAVLHARKLAAFGPIARLRGALEAGRGGRGALGLLAQLVHGLAPLLRPRFVLEASAWTIIAWCCYFGSLFTIADGMDIEVSRSTLAAASALGALSALLPVTISGLGAREVIFMQMLGHEGVSGPNAVVLSLVHLAMMTACAIGMGLLGLLARGRQHAAAGEAAAAPGKEAGAPAASVEPPRAS